MIPTVLILAVAFVLVQPAAAFARPDRGAIIVECPTLLQVARVLRLATPAQSAAYRDRLPAGCRERLLAEARVIIASHGQFLVWGERVMVPAGWSGDEFGHSRTDQQSDFRDIERVIEALKELNRQVEVDLAVAAGATFGGVAFGGTPAGRSVGRTVAAGIGAAATGAQLVANAIGSALESLGGGKGGGGGNGGRDHGVGEHESGNNR